MKGFRTRFPTTALSRGSQVAWVGRVVVGATGDPLVDIRIPPRPPPSSLLLSCFSIMLFIRNVTVIIVL